MALIKKLRKQGLAVERTGSGHWKVSNPEMPEAGFVIMAFSPRSTNQTGNLARLRKIGYRG